MTQNHDDQQTHLRRMQILAKSTYNKNSKGSKDGTKSGPVTKCPAATSYGGSAASPESLESLYRTATSIPCKCPKDTATL